MNTMSNISEQKLRELLTKMVQESRDQQKMITKLKAENQKLKQDKKENDELIAWVNDQYADFFTSIAYHVRHYWTLDNLPSEEQVFDALRMLNQEVEESKEEIETLQKQ